MDNAVSAVVWVTAKISESDLLKVDANRKIPVEDFGKISHRQVIAYQDFR
jgi:hypothetical protein